MLSALILAAALAAPATPAPQTFSTNAMAFDEIEYGTGHDAKGRYLRIPDSPPGAFDSTYQFILKQMSGKAQEVDGELFRFAYYGDWRRYESPLGEIFLGNVRMRRIYMLDRQRKTYVRFGPRAIDWFEAAVQRDAGDGLELLNGLETLRHSTLKVHEHYSSIAVDGMPATGTLVEGDITTNTQIPKWTHGVISSRHIALLKFVNPQLNEPCPTFSYSFYTFVPPNYCDRPDRPFVVYERVEETQSDGGARVRIVERGNYRKLTSADLPEFQLPSGYRNACAGLTKPRDAQTQYCF